MFSEYPTNEEFQNIYRELGFSSKFKFEPLFKYDTENFFEFVDSLEIRHWENLFASRANRSLLAFTFSKFYLDKGIPDEPYFISPGKNGVSVQFFPEFEKHHYIRQMAFSYHSDLFFHQAFAALDTIGHLLFLHFSLPLNNREKISFHTAVRKLVNGEEKEWLGSKLKAVSDSVLFQFANEIRNNSTHNQPHSRISSGVTRHLGGAISHGVGDYTSCKKILEAMQGTVECLAQVQSILREYSSLN